jgi:hypothetical protein
VQDGGYIKREERGGDAVQEELLGSSELQWRCEGGPKLIMLDLQCATTVKIFAIIQKMHTCLSNLYILVTETKQTREFIVRERVGKTRE